MPPTRKPQQKGERVSEYFDASKAELVVRRGELLTILTHLEKKREELKWYRRLWRLLQKFYLWSARAPMASDKPQKMPKVQI